MHDLRWRLLLLATPVLLACLILWPLAGADAALAALALLVLAYLLGHLYWMEKLYDWLKKPDLTTIPTGSGLWEDVFAALYHEMRRQRSSQSDLTSELEHFQRAASALPDGMLLLNERDQIEWCNPPAEQQLGLTLQQDAGQPISYLVRQTAFINYLQAQDFREPVKLKGLRSPDITLELQLVPFGDRQKLLLCRDITPLENLEIMRRDFIANVSHELRTPLTVVGGFLETLEDMPDSMPEASRQYLRLMQEQTTRMRHLVEDLLTLSQLESNQNVPDEEEVAVPALLARIAGEAESLSNGRHRIALQADPELRLTGVTDQLHSALGNLVSNAVRYTPDGGSITLAWQLRDNEAVFSVTDSGIGIEPQHLSRLTERFYRVDQSRSRATGGTGLGLSIVKHILLRHQARLEITSKPGVGSTFSAVFPAARVLRTPAAEPLQSN